MAMIQRKRSNENFGQDDNPMTSGSISVVARGSTARPARSCGDGYTPPVPDSTNYPTTTTGIPVNPAIRQCLTTAYTVMSGSC